MNLFYHIAAMVWCLLLLPNPKASTGQFMHSFYAVDQPSPSPDLLPDEVIAAQLRALQENDAQDSGIAITFNFASPGNRTFTGPLERFKQLVRNPVYEPMLNFKSYRAGELQVAGNQAQQVVVLTDKNGRKAAYLFVLSKQTESPFQNCWMTDSVIRLEMEEDSVQT